MSLAYPLEQYLGRRLRVVHSPYFRGVEGLAVRVKAAGRSSLVVIRTDTGNLLTLWAHRYEPVKETAR